MVSGGGFSRLNQSVDLGDPFLERAEALDGAGGCDLRNHGMMVFQVGDDFMGFDWDLIRIYGD